jgi:membrane protein DedA with SNARE-associated domain
MFSSAFRHERRFNPVIPWLHELLSHLTYSVSLDNPGSLAVLFGMGVMTEIGIPLLFAVEIFLLFASYYVGPSSIQVPLIILMLLLGGIAGASILYWLSYFLGDPFLNWLSKYLPWLCRRLEQIKARINERTTTAVTLVRLTPGFLQVPSLVTGSLRLKYLRFILGVIFSIVIYDIVIVAFGYIGNLVLGTTRQQLEDYFIIGFIAMIVAFWVVFYFRYRHGLEKKKS